MDLEVGHLAFGFRLAARGSRLWAFGASVPAFGSRGFGPLDLVNNPTRASGGYLGLRR